MSYLLFYTKRQVIDVKKNEDGSLLLSNGDGKSIAYAGSLINSQGGIDAFLSKCVQSEKSAQEVAKENAMRAVVTQEEHDRMKAERKKIDENYKLKIKSDYNELMKLDVIPTNAENVEKVMRYLNTQNWGGWELPKMTIGYSCNQYDCDGKTASTMTLDEPIDYDGEMVSKFQVGAPIGHLKNYRRIL